MADFDPTFNGGPQDNGIAQVSELQPQKPKGNKFTRNTSHPVALIFTLIFTFFPIIYGIVAAFINISMAGNYISFALGIAFNYYNMKNFAGRFLGKLRWHTYIVEGKTYYYFESMSRDGQSKCDSILFWTCLWFTPVYFIAITIAYIFLIKIMDIPMTIVGAIAGIQMLTAYIRCSADYKKKMKNMASDVGKKVVEQQLQGL